MPAVMLHLRVIVRRRLARLRAAVAGRHTHSAMMPLHWRTKILNISALSELRM